jgi:hypothetical protein
MQTHCDIEGRGRDEDCSSPPAQIRTCGFPASGSCLRSNVIGIRGMGYPCSSDPWARRSGDMLVPALCPEHAVAAHPPLDRPPSLHHLRRRCHSALFEASSVLCSRPTPHPRACSSFGCCLHEPVRCACPDTSEVSQVPYKGRLHVHGVSDCARLLIRKPFARRGCCFPANRTASAPRNSTRFAAQYPAHGLPCERFKLSLTASPCITRGRGGWLGLTPWKTCTSYPLPAFLAHTANGMVRPRSPSPR